VNEREPRLGIDIGRVIIIDGWQEVPGAVDAIARLVPVFGGRVWLVSKCGPRMRELTLRWLAAHDFHRRSGVPADHVRFCRTRPEKRGYCVELRLTHFVDDHPEVHAAIRGTVDHQYLFGPPRRPVPPYAEAAPTWSDVERLIGAGDDGGPA
jgi:hypothetical protein